MDQQLICELNLALIPETELASRHVTFSRQMAGRYRSLIQLNGVTPKVRPLVKTVAEVMGPSAEGPAPCLVDDLGREHRHPVIVLVSNNPMRFIARWFAAPARRSPAASSGSSSSTPPTTARALRGEPGPCRVWG